MVKLSSIFQLSARTIMMNHETSYCRGSLHYNLCELNLHDAGYTKGISYSSASLLQKETKDKKTRNIVIWFINNVLKVTGHIIIMKLNCAMGAVRALWRRLLVRFVLWQRIVGAVRVWSFFARSSRLQSLQTVKGTGAATSSSYKRWRRDDHRTR